MNKWVRGILKIIAAFTLLALAFFCYANIWVVASTSKYIFDDIESIEPSPVALVLGTSKRTAQGYDNYYFHDRIEGAARLYQEGKVQHLLMSGDNRTKYYNEPVDMRKALMDKEVPKKSITLDYAGLRTFDSVVRCKEVFGQEDIIIVTQRYHAYRAVFIARKKGIRAQALATDYNWSFTPQLRFREMIARALAVSDIYIFRKSPRYLGPQETLPR
jgi:SanA protein